MMLALMLTAVEGLFFTMSECVRLYALLDVATGYTTEAVESCFSEYNSYLWDKYHILGMDMAYGMTSVSDEYLRNRLCSFANENSNPDGNINMLRLNADFAQVNYTLLTDKGASAVIAQGVEAYEAGLLKNIYKKATEHISSDEMDVGSLVGGGASALDSARADANAARQRAIDNGEEDIPPQPYEVEDDPINAYKALREMVEYGMLYQGLPASAELSTAIINSDEQVSKRSLHAGNKDSFSAGLVDSEIYTRYLMSEYSCFTNDRNHDGLQYEVEYVICGQDSDESNLASVMGKILLIREGVNVLAILSDPYLMGQAESMATALCAAVFAPHLVAVVTPAVVAAWAYVESVLEIRAIMSGDKVAITKNSSNWNSDLFHLSGCLSQGVKAVNVEGGIGYEEYLSTFLIAQAATNTSQMGLRSCDVMENALHTQMGYENVRLDNMITNMDTTINYSANQLFLSFVYIPGIGLDGYQIKKSDSIDYCCK